VLPFLADHNFNLNIIRGLRRRAGEQGVSVDVVTALDEGLAEVDDPGLLDWAAAHGRIILTHDVNTLVGFAWKRIADGAAMPGVFAAADDAPIGRLVEDLLLLSECTERQEWSAGVLYLPLP
jgi:hypothetical protein